MRQPSMSKVFLSLSLSSAVLFLLISVLLLANSKLPISNRNDNLLGTFTFSTERVISILAIEIPLINDVQAVQNDSISQFGTKWFEIFSLFSPKHPNDWLKEEVPVYSLITVDPNNIASKTDFPIELSPPESFFEAEKNKSLQNNNQTSETVQHTTGDKEVIFIYHTHNRESFLPELDTDKLSEAYHSTTNVTLVGQKLGEELENLGIGSVISTQDYWSKLETGKYYLSYKYSLETVHATLQENKDIKYILDIHRDASNREKTTRKINGVNYGAVYFVIGEGNKNYQENKEFALEIHESLEKLYPGLSKGVVSKAKTNGTNGEYNQSVSPYSLTIEIGGVYNTLEEEYRTARALAEAIADVYWDAEMVNVSN